LLTSTAAHLHLQRLFDLSEPRYFHVPVAVNAAGQKLSKQTGAAAVNRSDARVVLRVLAHLGLEAPAELAQERPGLAWQWAAERWRIESLQGLEAKPHDPAET